LTILYWVFSQSSPAWASHISVVVVASVEAAVVVSASDDAEVVESSVAAEVVESSVAAEVVLSAVDGVVVVASSLHFPSTQLSPSAHVPCLLPHSPLTGMGSDHWQYQSTGFCRDWPASSQGLQRLPEQHGSPVGPIGVLTPLKHLESPGI